MNLYDIDTEYLAILDAFEFAETEEEIADLEKRLESIEADHEAKGENYCKLLKTWSAMEKQAEAQRKVFSDLAAEWAGKRDAYKNRRARVGSNFLAEKKRLGFGKRKYGAFSTWTKESSSVEIKENAEVPAQYLRPGPPDLTLIKEKIEAGEELEFATVVEKETLMVR